MTRNERIAVIGQCEKAIYDHRKGCARRANGWIVYEFKRGLIEAENILRNKQKRLKKKLKK